MPRFFTCISKAGALTASCEDLFKKGNIYQEAYEDFFGNTFEPGLEDDYTGALFLYSDYVTTDGFRVPLHVNTVDFELAPTPIQICQN